MESYATRQVPQAVDSLPISWKGTKRVVVEPGYRNHSCIHRGHNRWHEVAFVRVSIFHCIACGMLCFATVVDLTGCGKQKPGRVAIHGRVKFEGLPVANGSIAFRPAMDTAGPAAGTDIKDGQYRIPQTSGPAVGAYRVRLTIVTPNAPKQATNVWVPKSSPQFATFDAEVRITRDNHTYDIVVPLEIVAPPPTAALQTRF